MKALIERIFNYLATFNWFNDLIHKKYFKYKLRTVKQRTVTEKKPRLLFAPVPILNNKYWSEALKEEGYESKTLMSSYYSHICKKEDFDLYFEEVVRSHRPDIPLF